jgi:hypothetical protein
MGETLRYRKAGQGEWYITEFRGWGRGRGEGEYTEYVDFMNTERYIVGTGGD